MMGIRMARHGEHVVLVTIDHQPRRQAMTRPMLAELARLWDTFERASDRCIILTGAGEHACCVGADMRADLSVAVETAHVIHHALFTHHPFSTPIIAAVNGDGVGGGLERLRATDIRATVPHACFGLPEVRWSIDPFGGGTVTLVQQIGDVHAMALLLTAHLIDATTAAQIGLVNRVVRREALLPWALETAATIAANSPTAVQAVKQQISTTLACAPAPTSRKA